MSAALVILPYYNGDGMLRSVVRSGVGASLSFFLFSPFFAEEVLMFVLLHHERSLESRMDVFNDP